MKKRILKKLYTLLVAFLAFVCSLSFVGCDALLLELGPIFDGAFDELLGDQYEDGEIDESYVYTRTEGGGDYYYRRLSAKQRQFYKKIRIDLDKFFDGKREMQNYTYEGQLYGQLGSYRYSTFGLTAAECRQAFDALYQDCPQYYAYDGIYLLYDDVSLSPILSIEYAKKSTRDAIDGKIAAAVSSVEYALRGAADDLHRFEIIYDYVMGQVEYEYDDSGEPSQAAHAGSIVGVFDGDKRTNSVCVGYTFAITYLCNVFGVECISVGNIELNHAWNMVKMDGCWYHADATNDDGSLSNELFLCSEDIFWNYFGYIYPVYDAPNADSMGKIGILPEVEEDLCYSQFTYRNVQGGLEATGIGRDQYLLKLPASYHGQSVVSIGFDFCSTAALRWLILPTSIQKITALAFFKNAPEIIFYEGTAEEFARVSIGSMNDALSNTTVCYYSEQIPPNDGGNYWYYAENGAPCVWEIFTEESAQP